MRARITTFAVWLASLMSCTPSEVAPVAPTSMTTSTTTAMTTMTKPVVSKRFPACIASPTRDAPMRLGDLALEDIEGDPAPLGDLDGDGQDDVALVARSYLGNHGVGPRVIYLSRGGCIQFAGVVDNPVVAASEGSFGVRDMRTFFPSDPCGSYTTWVFDGAAYVAAAQTTCWCDPASDYFPTCATTVLAPAR